ncbi:MAG: hypothetical protein M1823_003996 [Watsoniomyces obsoletus]|nr:MAG: hypothetical protein M1823_003996 [Watsoniomyces obsoletus]
MAIADPVNEYAYMAQSLPTPSDTPYHTPYRSLSRPSSRYESMSPGPSSSPPPLPPDQFWGDGQDSENKEKISILDPRRFTPTLHASLVSEILSLRRDVDAKRTFIDDLEGSLAASRNENEKLSGSLSNNAKETRSLRRQLQLLEGGSSSALEELTRERDEALENVAEVKRRLDASQKKVRAEEENSNRVQRLWDRDRQTWEDQRRTMERKVHVVEGRLKAILEEVAAQQQAASQARSLEQQLQADSDEEEYGVDGRYANHADSASIRSLNRRGVRPMSAMSTDSVRFSLQYGPNGFLGGKLAGLSLADELKLDEEEDPAPETIDASDIKTADNPANHDEPAHQALDRGSSQSDQSRSLNMSEIGVQTDITLPQDEVAPHVQIAFKQTISCVDTGIQFSPPPSPKEETPAVEPSPPKAPEEQALSTDHEANQRRKRVSLNPSSTILDTDRAPKAALLMVSTSCQTVEVFPNVVQPSQAALHLIPEQSLPSQPQPNLTTSGTQTDLPSIPEPQRSPPPPPPAAPQLPIPAIAIHPPTSAPPSPGPSVLPPQTKHASCQVTLNRPRKMRSVAMQTEEIRIDKRTVKLPPNLLPTAIFSGTATANAGSQSRQGGPKPQLMSKRDSRRSLKKRLSSEIPSSPPHLISSPNLVKNTTSDVGHDVERSKRQSDSGGYHDALEFLSSDEGDDYADDWTGEGFRTALSAPRPRVGSRYRGSSTAGPSGEGSAHHDSHARDAITRNRQSQSQEMGHQRRTSGNSVSTVDPPMGLQRSSIRRGKLERLSSWNMRKASTGRRPSPLSIGPPNHLRRTGSPDVEQIDETVSNPIEPTPPFPVPTRLSSRRVPLSASDGAQSPTRRNAPFFAGPRRGQLRRSPTKDHLRKTRSSTTIPQTGHPRRSGSRSPTSIPSPLASPLSPPLPPLPKGVMAAPRPGQLRQRATHSQQPSNKTSQSASFSVDGSVAQNEIVDAIAQTMVGEWMWKYVRRRSSFGVAENGQYVGDHARAGEEAMVNAAGNGVRHKRWVWLAPYERTVMWSSKQPTSGPALLGKSGRKLVIQSVLDVKDDTPSPRLPGGRTLFNRSILILTPARALKFTATSRERHYVWLNALSFLSRPSLAQNELMSLPPPPVPEMEHHPKSHLSGLRRHPIRDSIRVAKSKNRSVSSKTETSVPASVRETIDEGSSTTTGLAVVIAADPPTVPRFSTHGRHRSNTGGAPPLGGLRSFSHPPLPLPSSHQQPSGPGSHGRSEPYGSGSLLNGQSGLSVSSSGPGTFSHRTSEMSTAPGLTRSNFFDAVGTVRMEAFVRGSTPSPVAGHRGPQGSPQLPLHDGHHWPAKQQPWSGKVGAFDHRFEVSDEFLRADDPFRGF